MTTQLETRNLESKIASPVQSTNKFKGVPTLRRRLLTSILPAVLLPLVVASALGYKITENKAKNRILERLEANTVLAQETVTTFVRDSFDIIDLIVANPRVIEAMKTGNRLVNEQNLARRPIESVEQQFAQTKLVQPDASIYDYLRKIVESSRAAEIHFSERHGFNVGYSNQTTDFVQSDEDWWQVARAEGSSIGQAEFDESVNTSVLQISKAISDSQTGEFLGVIKANMSVAELDSTLGTYLYSKDAIIETTQVVDLQNGFVISNINHTDDRAKNLSPTERENIEVVGNQAILQAAKTLKDFENDALSLAEAQQTIADRTGFSEVDLHQDKISSQTITTALFRYQNNLYSLSSISQTEIVSIAVVDSQAVAEAGRSLLLTFVITGIILGAIAVGLIVLLARQISQPISNLSNTTQQVAAGDLDVKAELEGSLETRTLASNFNILVKQVKESLQQQQTLAKEQRQEKEQLEAAIYTLIEEVSDATEGDLTVRANLDSMELSTVADLFNAIIDNLQEIALEVKHSSSQVGYSLKQNEQEIRKLAEQAIAETKETHDTLKSIAKMSQSIQVVAANASQAEKIADNTYNTVLNSTHDMDSTVDSILNLRTTISETAKKMKRLGESSQKISQAVSFIEEIALKTNILAINASVEARRAGEYGQGFTIVAEQVGALAEQSSAATKEIASIVSGIQAETQEVNQAMESGTTQVVETTDLVETTKQGLNLVLEKSQEINQLMSSISQTTISQADTSQNVTELMQKIAQLSATTSMSSAKVAQSIVETAQIAAKLESTVGQFKVAE